MELTLEKSMVGIPMLVEEVLRLESVSTGWTKKSGMVVMPESERPLTPALDSSKALMLFIRSSVQRIVVVGAIFI